MAPSGTVNVGPGVGDGLGVAVIVGVNVGSGVTSSFGAFIAISNSATWVDKRALSAAKASTVG